MTTIHYIGVLIILLAVVMAGVYAGKQVRCITDYITGGRRASVGMVAGAIIGTMVGGSSTIGTAQLAYHYGFSAWWFTLGGGIGVLVMGRVFAGPLYNSKIETIPQLFDKEYGGRACVISAIFNSVGSFLSVVAQVLAGIALITTVTTISAGLASVIVVIIMVVYVVLGGAMGTGYVGVIKMLLMYVGVGICGIIAFRGLGGAAGIQEYPVFAEGNYFTIYSVWGSSYKYGGRGCIYS